MKIGISLACFYPQHPEDTIKYAKDLGFDTAELFVNTISELDSGYISEFKQRCNAEGITIYSLHPFTSALENYMFFSPYDRRIEDSKLFYELYCKTAIKLGAKVINIHGDRATGLNNIDQYIRCLDPLLELTAKYGVTLSHENVFFNSINHPEFVYKLRSRLGKNTLKFTFDIKQAHKGGTDPYELCEAMGSDIINFHINDYDDNNICLLPGRGIIDYAKIFNILNKNKYDGPALIEVYSDNYKTLEEIKKSAEILNKIIGLQK